jgi:S1-C subfamily serine protease
MQGMPELAAAIRQHKPGDTVTLTVVRGGKEKKIKVKLGTFE